MTPTRFAAPLALLAVLAAPTPADALRPTGAPAPTGELEVASELAAKAPVRSQPAITVGGAPLARLDAWAGLVEDAGPSWTATWDRATQIPRRLFGSGLSAPGSVADAAVAETFARSFLARHIALLAPGARASDFELVSNRVDRGLRVVGFIQTHRGIRVLGGQVSFRFKNDRLFVVGSEALPNVEIATPTASLSPLYAQVMGSAWVLSDAAETTQEAAAGEPVIVPLVGDDRVHGYRLAVPVTVEARAPVGRWEVYLDAATGDRIARRQTLHFANGSILYNAPERRPGAVRLDYPAVDTAVAVDGLDLLTDGSGGLSWAGTEPGELLTRTAGQAVDVRNQAGVDDTGMFTIAPDGQIVWDVRDDELIDAQITTYVHARIAKEFARTLDPGLDFLGELQIANVNIDDTCNAFSDGTTINFFKASTQCANTGRLADVVYHEFGHALHSHAVIDGVGSFNSAHSEGLSDFFSAAITGDPGMGRGFFHTDAPLRHIDPTDREARWPDDVAGPHTTGLIFSGAMWDLRKMMIQKLGAEEGAALVNRLFYATLQRATDIPSTYIEVLVEDDDDGDLTNGTPNGCDINAAFGPHGLRRLAIELSPLASERPGTGDHPVSVTLSGLFPQCPGDQIGAATLRWRLASAETFEPNEVAMTEVDGAYEGTIPAAADGETVFYRITIDLADLTSLSFPDNPADRRYEFYVGETVELYCHDFETDPFLEGWTHGLSAGTEVDGADDWAWGAPQAPAASGDPPTPFSGEGMIGNDLGGATRDGKYQADITNFALSPEIAVADYSDVHLQFWRWLVVEDAFYDQATIYVNDEIAWRNFNSDMGTASSIHHEDREWRFTDVPISEHTVDRAVRLKFEVSSDGGLEFGGWNIDELCVVANVNSICGDGTISGAEDCDDGSQNSDTRPDGCRSNCALPECGDGIVDSAEDCDDGNLINGDECNALCQDPNGDGGCGCQSGAGSGQALGALLILGLFGLLRRRRRRQSCGR